MSEDMHKSAVADRMAEVTAMGKLAEAFSDLTPDAIGRVLRWALDSYGAAAHPAKASAAAAGTSTVMESGNGNGVMPAMPDNVGEFFHTAAPTTEADKALVVGYWLQFVKDQDDFGAYEVNAALNNLGERIGNITNAFETLKARKPALVIQLKKAGTTKQARKTYKVTLAGKRLVEEMVGQPT